MSKDQSAESIKTKLLLTFALDLPPSFPQNLAEEARLGFLCVLALCHPDGPPLEHSILINLLKASTDAEVDGLGAAFTHRLVAIFSQSTKNPNDCATTAQIHELSSLPYRRFAPGGANDLRLFVLLVMSAPSPSEGASILAVYDDLLSTILEPEDEVSSDGGNGRCTAERNPTS